MVGGVCVCVSKVCVHTPTHTHDMISPKKTDGDTDPGQWNTGEGLTPTQDGPGPNLGPERIILRKLKQKNSEQ